MHFVWKIPTEETETNLLRCNLEVISGIKKDLPIFQRRITKREFKNALGFAAPSHLMRKIFKELTSDNSAPSNLTEAEIDRRLDFSLLSGDSDIMVDLRHQSASKESKYEVFFKATENYLQEDVGVACHERRHNQELYLAKAVSFRDLHDPSNQWSLKIPLFHQSSGQDINFSQSTQLQIHPNTSKRG